MLCLIEETGGQFPAAAMTARPDNGPVMPGAAFVPMTPDARQGRGGGGDHDDGTG